MKSGAMWRLGAAWGAALAVLAGCGGSGGSAEVGAQTAAPVLKAEAWIQPASVDQGVPNVKSRSALVAPPTPSRVSLGALEESKTAGLGGGNGRRLVGVSRDVVTTQTAEQTAQKFQWKPTATGGQVAAISFTAEGAHGLRLGVVARMLPPGSLLRVYSQANAGTVFQISGQEVLQRIERNARAGDTTLDGQTWWTPEIGSDEVTLELELPAGAATSAVDLSVPRVSHIFENLSIPSEDELSTKINESASCQLDASCYEAYANQRNAVARMIFTSGGGTYACTGTLLNDSRSSGTPYFLTANHCISKQAEASSLQTDWFYRAPTCNSRTLSSTTVKRVNGAALLYASATTDTSFLQLNDAPPTGAVFAGWDAGTQTLGSPVVGLHHPKADLLKVSMGSLSSLTSCAATSGDQFQCSGSSGNYYRVTWSEGTTEGGSSGSALFKDGTYVIGTLYGGGSSCSATTAPDFYGRFDVAYNAALQTWLSGTTPPTGPTGRVPVYRFYNIAGLEHFYTSSVAERDLLLNQYGSSFVYEGPIFYAYPIEGSGSNFLPVFRLVDVARKLHIYTANPAERDGLRQVFPSVQLEGTAWWGGVAPGNGSVPVYRFRNRVTGTYLYTASPAERSYINANMGQQYVEEGIGFYVWADK